MWNTATDLNHDSIYGLISVWNTCQCCRNQLAPIKSSMSLFPIVIFTKQTNTWFAEAQPSPCALNAKSVENFSSVTYSIPCTFFTENTLYMVQSTIPETHLQAKSLTLHSNTSSPQTEPCGITNRAEINEKTVNNCTLQKCYHLISEQNYLLQSTQFAT
jgi:hypothetical protein